jgi:serine/threonine protein kinase
MYYLTQHEFLSRTLHDHDYALLHLIGRGGNGEVYLARHCRTKEYYAVKVTGGTNRAQELQALQSIWHPHIVYLYEAFTVNDLLFLVFEYCPGGCLALKVQGCPIPRSDLFPICRQLISAVKACHAQRLAHLDIKPGNVLIDKHGRVKLADFGLSQMIQGDLSGQFKGTPIYLPPEILQKRPYDPFKADIWSLGVTLYCLAVGQKPWTDLPLVFRRPLEELGEIDPCVPKRLASLLRKMIRLDPDERIGIDQIDLTVFEGRPVRSIIRNSGRSVLSNVRNPFVPGSFSRLRQTPSFCGLGPPACEKELIHEIYDSSDCSD